MKAEKDIHSIRNAKIIGMQIKYLRTLLTKVLNKVEVVKKHLKGAFKSI
jgi:hypothetical protein